MVRFGGKSVDLDANDLVASPLAQTGVQEKQSFRNRSEAKKVYSKRAADVEMMLSIAEIAGSWLVL